MHDCSRHRTPRAGVDPIDHPDTALAVVTLAADDPPRPATIVLLLDHEHRGVCVTVVSGTARADDSVEVADHLAGVATTTGRIGAMVVATVRPGGGLLDDDVDRWLEMSELVGAHGVELLEWFVLGTVTECPRDRLGEPPRWRAS
jgi:hypothetical protein